MGRERKGERERKGFQRQSSAFSAGSHWCLQASTRLRTRTLHTYTQAGGRYREIDLKQGEERPPWRKTIWNRQQQLHMCDEDPLYSYTDYK